MSFAVIQTGGKQYKVRSGEILKIEKLPNSKPDTKIEFKEILAYGDEKVIEIGDPTVKGAKVEANLIKNNKNSVILLILIIKEAIFQQPFGNFVNLSATFQQRFGTAWHRRGVASAYVLSLVLLSYV